MEKRERGSNIKAVGKNIKWIRGKRDGYFEEVKKKILKMVVGKNIELQGTLYTPVRKRRKMENQLNNTPRLEIVFSLFIIHSIQKYFIQKKNVYKKFSFIKETDNEMQKYPRTRTRANGSTADEDIRSGLALDPFV